MKKKIILILIIIISLFSIIFIVYKININKKTTQIPIDKIAQLGEIKPGETTIEQINKLLGKPVSSTSIGNLTTLDYKSTNEYRNHQIEVENGKVYFIKEIVNPTDNKNSEDIRLIYGVAPYILHEKEQLNPFDLYTYPSNGIAYVGHKDGTILEIWYFKKTDINDFLQTFGKNYSLEQSKEIPKY